MLISEMKNRLLIQKTQFQNTYLVNKPLSQDKNKPEVNKARTTDLPQYQNKFKDVNELLFSVHRKIHHMKAAKFV